MRPIRRLGVALVAVVLLAGCAGGGINGEAGVDTRRPAAVSTTTEQPPPPADSPPETESSSEAAPTTPSLCDGCTVVAKAQVGEDTIEVVIGPAAEEISVRRLTVDGRVTAIVEGLRGPSAELVCGTELCVVNLADPSSGTHRLQPISTADGVLTPVGEAVLGTAESTMSDDGEGVLLAFLEPYVGNQYSPAGTYWRTIPLAPDGSQGSAACTGLDEDAPVKPAWGKCPPSEELHREDSVPAERYTQPGLEGLYWQTPDGNTLCDTADGMARCSVLVHSVAQPEGCGPDDPHTLAFTFSGDGPLMVTTSCQRPLATPGPRQVLGYGQALESCTNSRDGMDCLSAHPNFWISAARAGWSNE